MCARFFEYSLIEGVADGREPVKTALNYTKFPFCIIASIERDALPAGRAVSAIKLQKADFV